MKYKTKKILITSSITFGAASIIAAGAIAYFLSPTIQSVAKNGVYVFRQNIASSNFGYKYDMSSSYGSTQTNSLGTLITSNLLHLKTEGKLIVDPKTNHVKEPSLQSYEFSLGDSIVLTFKHDDGREMEIEFDSDDAEIVNIPSDNTNAVVEKNSANKRSINNHDIFQAIVSIGALNGTKEYPSAEAINKDDIDVNGTWKLRKMGLTVKPNVKWVDANGNQTKYNVCVDDFWYSFMRTKLYDRQYRRNNGGSQELDQYFINKTNATSRFKENDRFPNEYLFSFFDIDSEKLYNHQSAIQKTKSGKEMLTFTSFENINGIQNARVTGFSSIIKKFLVNSFTFSAAPSEYIKELAQNDSLNIIGNVGEIKSLARQFGIYTYGQTRKTNLYASPYIPTSVESNREVYEYNRYFANKKWVERVEKGYIDDDGNKAKALNKIIFEYSGGIDTLTYNSQLLNSYFQGLVSEVKYSDLSPEQRQKIYGSSDNIEEIAKTAANNGLQYTKTINTSQFIQRTLVQSNPTNTNNPNTYGFDDQYSKLVFGMSKNELAQGNNNTTDAFFVNDGFEFRLLVQAAINWYTFVNQSFQNQRVMWLSGAAQDAQFSSFKTDSGTPIQHFETVNTMQFIDRTSGKPQLISITPKQMQEHASKNNNNQTIQIQSPEFELIAKNMKLILDKNQISGKMSWNIAYPWPDKDTIKATVLESVVNTINRLDSRLDAKCIIPKNRDEMLAAISINTGVSDYNGWAYDYEGIGSYISAFSNNHGVTILNAFAIYSSDDKNDPRWEKINTLQTMFPQFTKLAKFVKEYTDNEMKTKNIDEKYWVKNWDKVTNKANQDSSAYFLSVTNNQYDPSVSLAKAFKTYESEQISDEEWANLIRELNAIKGVSINADNSILNPDSASLSLYLKDYIVPVTKYGISYFQDYCSIIEKKGGNN